MSQNINYPFKSKTNFKNEYFYYYLPYYIKRNDIGIQIKRYQGVNKYLLFNLSLLI